MRVALAWLIGVTIAIPCAAPAKAGDLPTYESLEARMTAACGAFPGEAAVLRLPPAERNADIACRIRAIANAYAASFPLDGPQSHVTGVSADGMVLVYLVKVPALRENVTDQAIARAREQTYRMLCASAEMRSVLRMGGSFRYVLRDAADQPLGEFAIESC